MHSKSNPVCASQAEINHLFVCLFFFCAVFFPSSLPSCTWEMWRTRSQKTPKSWRSDRQTFCPHCPTCSKYVYWTKTVDFVFCVQIIIWIDYGKSLVIFYKAARRGKITYCNYLTNIFNCCMSYDLGGIDHFCISFSWIYLKLSCWDFNFFYKRICSKDFCMKSVFL